MILLENVFPPIPSEVILILSFIGFLKRKGNLKIYGGRKNEKVHI